jgi:hypothetical protein
MTQKTKYIPWAIAEGMLPRCKQLDQHQGAKHALERLKSAAQHAHKRFSAAC